MKKYLSFVLCLLLILGFTSCASSSGSAGKGGELDVDYVTTDGQTEESNEAEGSGSLLDWLRNKLAADKARRAAETADQEEGVAQVEESSAPAAGQNNRIRADAEEEETSESSKASSKVDNSLEEESESSENQENSSSSSSESSSSQPEDDEKFTKKTVTMHIRCDTAVAKGMHKDPIWAGIVPASGVILPKTTFEIKEGTTVFDVLHEACRKYNIHMQYSGIASSCYIQGINNLYEFDGGRWSGWMYSVDGVYPNYGAGVYFLRPGEVIEWNYTCDLGRDLPGGEWIAGTL